MKVYDKIKSKLENFVEFRERRFRGKYLAKLALRDLGLEEKFESGGLTNYDELVMFAQKYDTMRHEWDAVLRVNKDLRGQDYGDKKKLEQSKKIEFGYDYGYNQDLKLSKRI